MDTMSIVADAAAPLTLKGPGRARHTGEARGGRPETHAAALAERFRTVRAQTMAFAARLTPEDMMVQSCAEASPVKWHLAHTSWFFETFVLRDFLPGYTAFDADFVWLFNSYYKSLGEMPEKKLRASFSRPGLETILAYREHVDAGVHALLASGFAPEEALRRVVLGLEHEHQHLELAVTDIKHAFFTNPLHPVYAPQSALHFATASAALGRNAGDDGAQVASTVWIDFAPQSSRGEGVVEVGVTPDAAAIEAFAFDNETPRHSVYVAPFALASLLVTCAEYLRFIEADGYARPELWLSEGWDMMRAEGWQAPLYWRRTASERDGAGGWEIFTLGGFLPLEELAATPVCHVSLFEADAYARWAGCRLPTEFEWETAAADAAPMSGFAAHGASAGGNLLESGALHPMPAREGAGPQQMFGDVWEWTASAYTGYPGYRPLPGALGEYNGKFMSSQMVLRGGSCVTAATHIRATYRNFFSPGTRWQFSGIRLARSSE